MMREYLQNNVIYCLKFLKNLSKFMHINSLILTNLMYKGFCQPPDEDEKQDGQGDNDDDEGKFIEGTGIGEGQGGAENVSKEIEYEE